MHISVLWIKQSGLVC